MLEKSRAYKLNVWVKPLKLLGCFLGLVLLAFSLSQCSFKKNVPETPYAQDGRTEKSFFRKYDKNGKDIGPRTFLAGRAPVTTAGAPDEVILTSINATDHSNIEFEITESQLVGKIVNPSYPNDRSRWKTALSIPIKNHYYLERQKDGRGRETDTFFENSSRSHYSARPYINLDFSKISIKSTSEDFYAFQIDNVYDVEWDAETGFLAFTASATRHENKMNELRVKTATFRYNFLAFDHDTSFKPTPYAAKNSQYLNVLHVLGKYEEGDPINSVLYGAKWDTRKKHEIHLHDFPAEYQDIAIESVELWNDAFERVGHGRPFVPVVSDSKYTFDLRHTALVWINDRRASYNAPLGIGQAMADVKNGKILWGQVTLWGGRLQEIINAYSPNADISSQAKTAGGGSPIVQLGLMNQEGAFSNQRPLLPPEILASTSFEHVKAGLMNSFEREAQEARSFKLLLQDGKVQDALSSELAFNPVASLVNSSLNPQNILDNPQALFDYLTQIEAKTLAQLESTTLVNQMSQDINNIAVKMQQATQAQAAAGVYGADYIQKLIGMPTLQESLAHLPVKNPEALNNLLGQQAVSKQAILDYLNQQNINLSSSTMYDQDRTFSDQAAVWEYGMQKYNIDKVSAIRAVAKDLILHEIGHMIGLGHNFKENILPKSGSVPETSKYHLDPELFKYSEQERRAKENFTNYSTVMGYKHGITDILTAYEDIMPGPHDLLVLEYLYNSRYPVYPVNAEGKGDFQFQKLTEEGLIKENLSFTDDKGQTTKYRVAFYPQCNDVYATYTVDPYCTRWDRGYNAPTLVENHFESYNGNLMSQLNAFSDSVNRGSPESQENYLWYKSLNTFSRVRLFYDYMRQTYEKDIHTLLNAGVEKSSSNLLNFSETCQYIYNKRSGKTVSAEIPDQDVYNFFTAPGREELVELCAANAKTMKELETLLQLPGKDYTVMDYTSKYATFIQGNEVGSSFNKIFGAWKELARRPIKISALLTLTSPRPYIMLGGWTWPVPIYSRPDGGYHLSSLYPKEYTSAIAYATEMNLTMGNTAFDTSTSIGRTILSMGYFLNQAKLSNDSLRLSAPYIENIRNQTNFKFNIVTVKVTRKVEDGKELAKKFSAVVSNPYLGISETLPEIYMYTNDRTVILPPPQSLMMPLTSIRWMDNLVGYYYAIKLDYSDDFYDRLKTKNVRKTLEEAYYPVMKKCIEGENFNGLRYFFNEGDENQFSGFEFPNTIALKTEDKNRFFRSLESEFVNYYENIKESDGKKRFPIKPDPRNCEEALRSQGLLVMTAAILNGYFFEGIYDYIEKGN